MTEEQFTPLAQRYMDTVYRVAYSYLRSPSDADDVTQDVLIQLYKTDKAFESDAHGQSQQKRTPRPLAQGGGHRRL